MRKPPPASTTAAKSPSTCAGTRKGWRMFRMPIPADIGTKDIPSWRRVCKVLLNNTGAATVARKAATISSYRKAHGKTSPTMGYYATTTDAGAGSLPQSWMTRRALRLSTRFARCLHHSAPSARSPSTACCGSNMSWSPQLITTRITCAAGEASAANVAGGRRLPSRSSSSSNAHRRIRLSMVFTAMSWPAAKPC